MSNHDVELLPVTVEPTRADDAERAGPEVNPFEILHNLLRGRYVLAIPTALLLGVIGALVAYGVVDPVYRSTGLIRVKSNKPVILYDSDENGTMPAFQGFVDAQMNILQSQRVVDAAMQDPQWQALKRGISPAAIGDFVQSLEIDRAKNSEVISVSFTDSSPHAAVTGAGAVIRAYLRLHGESDTRDDTERLRRLEDRRSTLAVELRDLRQAIHDIASEFGSDALEERYQYKLGELNKVESELKQVQLSMAAAEAAAEVAPPTGAPSKDVAVEVFAASDRRLQRYLDQRDELQLSLLQFRQRHGEKHPAVGEAQATLAVLDGMIHQRVEVLRALPLSTGPGAAGRALGVEALRAHEANLTALFDALKSETTELGRKALRIGELRQRVREVQEKLAETDRRLDELHVESLGEGRVEAMSFGEKPLGPHKDRRLILAGAAGAGGLATGFALFLLLGLIDRRLRSSDDASSALNHNSRLLGILPTLPDDMADLEQTGIAVQCIHHIRVLMQLRRGEDEQRVFLLTSPAAGDGKTSLTLALGMSYGMAKVRTLLIDCDIIGGGLTVRTQRLLRPESPHDSPGGLLAALGGAPLRDCAIATEMPSLMVLPLGDAGPEHVGQLSAAIMRRVLAEAREQFDAVLVDAGPILGSLEASIVAPEADGVVLIVSRGEQRPMAEQAAEYLRSTGARLTGVVFNRASRADLLSSSSVISGTARASQRQRRRLPAQDASDDGKAARLGPLPLAMAETMAGSSYGRREPFPINSEA